MGSQHRDDDLLRLAAGNDARQVRHAVIVVGQHLAGDDRTGCPCLGPVPGQGGAYRSRPRLAAGNPGQGLIRDVHRHVVCCPRFGQPVQPLCLDALDADDNGTINVPDAIRVLILLFNPSKALPSAYPDCGSDPTPDSLNCESYVPCE